MIDVHCEDALAYLNRCEKSRAGFADIPDNIGLKYKGHSDSMPESVYRDWCRRLLKLAVDKFDIFWLSWNIKHAYWMYQMMPMYTKQIVWTYNFGQYQIEDFANCYRPISLIMKSDIALNFNAVKITSTRMAMGDKRAVGPRSPSDVWEYPRVVGNTKERRSWHPTQHPEALMTRIVLLSCTKTTFGKTDYIGSFTDLCLGSGTSAIVCHRLGIDFVGIDNCPTYVEKVKQILEAKPKLF